jgi:hypothetical protein
MTKFFLFSLGFACFFMGAFMLTMCIITGETAVQAWIGAVLFTFAGCLGVGKFLDCYV